MKASLQNRTTNPKLLAVLAHPDDETFGMGGTLALYARRGCEVYLVCATHGEVGTVDAEYMGGYGSIAELRGGELRCAAEHLGLKEVFFLGYRDSGMAGSADNRKPAALVAHSVDEVAGRIVQHIRTLRPDVVLTFDPIGGYRHPDHIHIHHATTLAFERSDDSTFHPESGGPFKPRALYYSIFPHKFLRLLTRLMPLVGINPRRFGRNRDIDLKALTAFDFPVHVKIDTRSVANAKTAASACHASQGGMTMRRGLMGFVTRLMGERENYMRAFPPADDQRRLYADLFEGV